MIFVSKMRGFGLVFSEIKTIWIKLYDHSANVPHVLGVSVDFHGAQEGLRAKYSDFIRGLKK